MKVAVKLGGSVITDKNSDKPEARKSLIKRLIKELSKFPSPFILTHGAGSYGHPLVRNWEDGKLKDFIEIHESVKRLNAIVLKYCRKFKLSFDCYSPFDTVTYDSKFNLDKLWKYGKTTLDNGKIFITHGDIVQVKNNFKVLSADVSTCLLAQLWKAEKIIWVIDKNGVYDKNPELYPNSKLIKRIEGNSYDVEFEITKTDVTGGLLEKIRQSQRVGIKSQIVNGLIKGNLEKSLNDDSIGTLVLG